MKIVTKGGRNLGRVFDLRSRGAPEHGLNHKGREINEIVYGTIGLLELLGLKQAGAETVAWESVIEIKDGTIIVADEQANENL